MSHPIPAATLVLLRDRADAPPELLMIERNGDMVFAAGALVFPGGRIDPGDREIAADTALAGSRDDPDEAAARIAAIRETIEEAGIAVGLVREPDAAALAALRAALAEGKPFAALLRDGGFRLDLDRLVPFARWCPNFRETRTFDTRFYLAEAPAGQKAAPDGGESVRALWASAADLVADADAGRHHVIFPTRRNLERLATFATFAEGRADARRYPVTTITPWVEEREGRSWLCIPRDRGYPICAQLMETVHRA